MLHARSPPASTTVVKTTKGALKKTQPVDSECSLLSRPKCRHRFCGLLLVGQQGIPLRRRTLQLALAGSLGLGTLQVHLVLEGLLALLLGLGAVDLFEGLR